MWLGRNMPRRVGSAIVKLAVPWIARRRQSALVRGIRVNQSVARGLPLDAPELDQAVRQVLYNAGRGYYEVYHRLGQGREAVQEAVTFSPEMFTCLQQAQDQGRGVLFIGPHIGNLDLGLLAFAAHGLSMQAITYAAPPGGYQLQNKMRADAGYIVTPADGRAVKMALRRLRDGGIVVTGMDRPLSPAEQGKPVQFFGLPAPLPTGYIRLALSTNAQLHMIQVEPTGGGTYSADVVSAYSVSTSPPIELIRTNNRKKDTILNTERALSMAEEIIRARPEEWMMFHPVWPQLLGGG